MTRAAAAVLACALAIPAAPVLRAIGDDALRAVEDESTVKLTTIGRVSGKPHTVTIWFVREGDHLFVQSGKDGHTNWYQNALVHPEIALHIGALKLRGRATPVTDPEETAHAHRLFELKYLRARITAWLGGSVGHGKVMVVEQLEPRS
jgi:deazaflavin-dependent oxidoreductase (nitroreductase family)